MYRLRSQCANCVVRHLQMCGVAMCSTTRLLSSSSTSSSSTSGNSANMNENDMSCETSKSQSMKNEGEEQQQHNTSSSSSFAASSKDQTTNTHDTNKGSNTTNNNNKHNSTIKSDSGSSKKDELWSLERDSTEENSKTSHYRFPTQDVLNAVKKGDFDKIQAHATALVKHNWRDEYIIPTYCVGVLLMCWWFAAWRSRALRRRCNKLMASIEQEASQMVERVRGLTEKYAKDMVQAQQRMEGIIDKNSALTTDIDRMTTILRSCSIKPTPETKFQ